MKKSGIIQKHRVTPAKIHTIGMNNQWKSITMKTIYDNEMLLRSTLFPFVATIAQQFGDAQLHSVTLLSLYFFQFQHHKDYGWTTKSYVSEQIFIFMLYACTINFHYLYFTGSTFFFLSVFQVNKRYQIDSTTESSKMEWKMKAPLLPCE